MSENQPKPVAINLMEIWVTGRQMERVRALWRACNRDNTPATEWRPMNPGVAKKALRSGVFTVTFEGQQSIFCAREFPRERLQAPDYARLQLLNTMARNHEALPPLVMPAPVEVPAETLPAMERVQEFDSIAQPVPSDEKLDAAADSVIADITGQAPADAAAPSGDSPTPLSDGSDSLATDGGVSIPAASNTAGATEESNDNHESGDGGRESDRGSEVQSND